MVDIDLDTHDFGHLSSLGTLFITVGEQVPFYPTKKILNMSSSYVGSHLYVGHESNISGTRLVHMCDMAHYHRSP